VERHETEEAQASAVVPILRERRTRLALCRTLPFRQAARLVGNHSIAETAIPSG
jgi:hypothetical protein